VDQHQVDEKATAQGPVEPIEWNESSDTYAPPLRRLEEFLANVELRGEQPEFAPLIFFEDSAHEQMWADATRDVTREHGGIMMGEAFQDVGGRYCVVVRAAIAAFESKGSPTHLQFRAESWQPVWDRLHLNPGLKIVGWYHTHPRLGVFLSGTDLRTQRLYFSAPWQIAVVIDPASREIGYFFGVSGKKAQFVRRFSEKKPPSERTSNDENQHNQEPSA
jgi:proteasome lid subunit RPN8/RPN11